MKFSKFNLDDCFITDPILVKREDMLDYAEKYDPQYFHVDETAADRGPFGVLIASGFFTMSIVWAKFIRMNILGKECLGGLGADDITWIKPVVENDRLIGEYKVVDKRMLADKERGVLKFSTTIKNQEHVTVMTFEFTVLIAA